MESDTLARPPIATAVDGIVVNDTRSVIRADNAVRKSLFACRRGQVIVRRFKMLKPSHSSGPHEDYLEHYRPPTGFLLLRTVADKPGAAA